MNLPQSATEFLDVFIGLGSKPAFKHGAALPRIHVYGFSTDADPVLDMARRAAAVMRCPVDALCLGPRAEGVAQDSRAGMKVNE